MHTYTYTGGLPLGPTVWHPPHLNGTCTWKHTLPTERCLIMLQDTYVLGLTAQQVVLSLARLTGGEKNNRPHFVQYAV